ncbi:MAG: NINE protein [Bacteroidota bacterium]|nr:NINE protein [Bacteroidota bacterium]
MKFKLSFLILFLCCFGKIFSENKSICVYYSIEGRLDSIFIPENLIENKAEYRPNPLLQLFRTKQKKNKKLVAAALAFPFPFGIVGLHRIYLGTAPYIPVVYIGTLGGGLGILPFIDFCVLVLDKNFERYNNNSKVFMWVNDDEKKSTK